MHVPLFRLSSQLGMEGSVGAVCLRQTCDMPEVIVLSGLRLSFLVDMAYKGGAVRPEGSRDWRLSQGRLALLEIFPTSRRTLPTARKLHSSLLVFISSFTSNSIFLSSLGSVSARGPVP